MKTILFLAFLSLSCAFVSEDLYNKDNLKTVADVMTGSALESLTDVKSSDSSDYIIVELCSDESDWSGFASEMIELFKPIFMNFNESYLEYLSNKTGLENDLLFSIVRFVNETILENDLFGDATDKRNELFNASLLNTTEDYSEYHSNNTDAYLERDILLSVAQFINETRTEKGLSEEDQSENDYIFIDIELYSNNSDSDSETIELLKPIFVNFTEDYSNNTNVNLERDILLSVAQFINETRTEKGVSDEDQNENDYLIIDIELYSDSSDSESEILELFKPIFMNFTEAYYEYLANNNVNLDDQTLTDDILTSIAQLFNETVEEKALYGDTIETNKTIETGKSENQSSFLGL